MWDEERGCRASLKHWRGGGDLEGKGVRGREGGRFP